MTIPEQIIQHDPRPFSIAITGGGLGFLGRLTEHGGASKILLSAHVPYAKEDFVNFIGFPITKFSDRNAACHLAEAAFYESAGISGKRHGFTLAPETYGIGVAASLAYPGQREGRENRVWIVKRDCCSVSGWGMNLTASLEREYQEGVIANQIEDLLSCGNWQFTYPTPDMSGLLAKPSSSLLFSGSFNPVHAGHLEMAHKAEEITGQKCVFEVCTHPYQKDRVCVSDLHERMKAIEKHGFECVFSSKQFFGEKLAYWTQQTQQEFTFVMGMDTFKRWTETTPDWTMLEKTKFLVFGRNGLTLNNSHPNVTFVYYNNPISSTEIRETNESTSC